MDKPFRTYDELVELMESRGLYCGDETIFVLQREGYYAVVNGYKDPFLASRSPERFRVRSRFADLYRLFVMDRHLRSTVFRFITLAEATLKSICTYEFCELHSDEVEPYLNPAAYRADRNYPTMVNGFIHDVNVMLDRDPYKKPRYMRPYVKHYIESHDNVPLWIVMNQLSLTQAFKFYDFLPENLRFKIANRFQALYDETHIFSRRITHSKLRKAYDHIKDFRNICAHDERLYCAKVDKSQSTSFRKLISDLNLVLTSNQYNVLTSQIGKIVERAASSMNSITENDILGYMGYSSLKDVRELVENS